MSDAPADAAPQCPDEQELLRAVNDELGPDDEARIARHVEGCPACAGRLARLGDALPVRAAVLRALEEDDGLLRTVCYVPPAGTGPPGAAASLGGYRVGRELGRGNFGVVYLAHEEALDRLVAIKVPFAEVVQALGGSDLYRQEARALARLDHPHIVRVHHAES